MTRTGNNRFEAAFGVRHPIVQGPMNGASPVELVAAVCTAGALGCLAASLLDPATIVAKVAELRRQVAAPFAVNLFVTERVALPPVALDEAWARLEGVHRDLGLVDAAPPARFGEDFSAQLEAVIAAAPPIASFTFGLLSPADVRRLHRAGTRVIGTATTVAEALAWEAAGADGVCAQGIEAGGHRATFIGDFEQSGIGLMALIPQVRAAVSIPVIAAGGIADGRGIAAAMLLGADAAQLGTAFLVTPEAGIARAWRNAVLGAQSDATRLTRSFSGRHARGIVNAFMERMRPHEAEFPPYPVQNAVTGAMRRAAAEAGNGDYMSLWAGQAAALAREMPAAALVDVLRRELAAFHATTGSSP